MAVAISAELKIRIASLWSHNLTSAEIGAEVGISAERVRKVGAELGLPRRAKPKAAIDDDELRRMWAAGVPRQQIADHFGVSYFMVFKRARHLELPRGERGGPRPARQNDGADRGDADFDEAAFRKLWADGVIRRKIADHFGKSMGWVERTRLRLRLRGRLGDPKRSVGDGDNPADRGDADDLTVPSMPAHPFWTPERDLMVLEAGGTYARVNALSARIGKPAGAILQRWHQLRAAG